MFERQATWLDDRMLLDDLVFRLEHYRRDNWDGGDHFRFYKIKELIDAYSDFFRSRAFKAERVLELGMWDGGSLAFWFEMLSPKKLVGIDLEDREDSDYFKQYVANRQLNDRIATYWRTNQGNRRRLQDIIRQEFAGPIDLVLDDASHLYEPTKASFEIIFSHLRPGGLYIIEDWGWKHWENFTPAREWTTEEPLTKLVLELVEATGTPRGAIANLFVSPSFVAIERGSTPLANDFRLDELIFRRKPTPFMKRVVHRALHGRERELLHGIRMRLGKIRRRSE